jgi:hypothetical protein
MELAETAVVMGVVVAAAAVINLASGSRTRQINAVPWVLITVDRVLTNPPSKSFLQPLQVIMKKKEIQAQVDLRLSNGDSKSSTFRQLSGQGVSDRVVAHMIASYASIELCNRHARLIDAMIVISWLQLAVAVLASIAMSIKSGVLAVVLITALVGAFAYLFVWGFTNNKAWAYNATILLSLINLPQSLTGFFATPISSTIGLVVGVGLIAFTWYVRGKLFPDFAFITPKKIKGTYVFSG